MSILLRVWGALWALRAIISIPSILFFAIQATDIQSRRIVISNGIVQLVWLVLGCVVFYKNEQIAAALFPNAEGELSISASSQELQEVGFSLLAVYFGIGAVSRLAGIIYHVARTPAVDDQSRFIEVAQRNTEDLITTAAQLLVCLVLFFGSKGLATFWSRLRGSDQEDTGGA